MNDAEFVQGLRDRSPAAVQHLTETYLPSIWRFVVVRVDGDRHVAEDIVSETVLALMRAAAADKEIDNPSGWLRGVANHKVQDHYRAVSRVQHLVTEVSQTTELTDGNDAVKQQELSERRLEIRSVMDALPERQRLVLEWKYIDKLSVREISARLDTTEKSVESVLFRARRVFRDKLQRKGQAPPSSAPREPPSRDTCQRDDQEEEEERMSELPEGEQAANHR